MSAEIEDTITKDGTTDIHGNPADRKKTGNWKTCPYILSNECCERLAYYGMSTNLVNFLKSRLNEGSEVASKNVNNWSGTCYLTPLLGAFVADAYCGRFATIGIFMIIYILGLVLLTIGASVKGINPAATVFVALYLIALGTGGIKPCVSSFGADQFDESDERERKRKTSFFNWFYFAINVGSLVAASGLVYVQTHVGWGWGFGIPAVAMAVAIICFFVGTPMYRHRKPGGSPFTRIAQVVVASVRKRGVEVPSDESLLFEIRDKEGSYRLGHTQQLKFFDKAAVETESDKAKPGISPWRLSTVTQVEELKSIVRLLPIWATGIIFSTVYSQMSTMFILQGNTLDPHMGPSFSIPAASLSIFDTISVILWVPLYDRALVPIARKFTGNDRGLTQLTRMGIGLFISVLAMLLAGTLEHFRLRIIARHDLYDYAGFLPLSIFWQIPQYFVIGLAEVFTFIGQIEFFYDQAPDAMRSTCSALSLTTNALGSYLSSLLVTAVTAISTADGRTGWISNNPNIGHMDYFFWLLAALSAFNFLAYLAIAKRYTYRKPAVSLPG